MHFHTIFFFFKVLHNCRELSLGDQLITSWSAILLDDKLKPSCIWAGSSWELDEIPSPSMSFPQQPFPPHHPFSTAVTQGLFSLLGNLVCFFWTGIKNFWMGLMKILDKDFESLGQGILKLMGRSIENGQGFWSFWQGRCKFKWLCMLRKRCSSNRAVHSLTWSISLPLSAIMSSQKGKFMGDLLYSSFLIK